MNNSFDFSADDVQCLIQVSPHHNSQSDVNIKYIILPHRMPASTGLGCPSKIRPSYITAANSFTVITVYLWHIWGCGCRLWWRHTLNALELLDANPCSCNFSATRITVSVSGETWRWRKTKNHLRCTSFRWLAVGFFLCVNSVGTLSWSVWPQHVVGGWVDLDHGWCLIWWIWWRKSSA